MFSVILSILIVIVAAVASKIFLEKVMPGLLAGLGAAVVIIGFASFTVVGAGERGVQVTFGDVNPVPLDSGIHFVSPFSSVREVNVQLQSATMTGASAGTKDLQQVHTDITINYHLNDQKVAAIYKDYGTNVTDKVLVPALNEAFKSVTGHYNSEELVTKRDIVSAEILEHTRAKLAQFDISTDGVSLVNFGFNADYQKAIEQKVIALQQKQKAEMDLQRIEVEAKSRIAQAEGEAKAIAIQAQAIQSNGGAQYVQLQWIEKWDGKMPETVVNGNTGGMMLNMGK
jgi:prohibitin 2